MIDWDVVTEELGMLRVRALVNQLLAELSIK